MKKMFKGKNGLWLGAVAVSALVPVLLVLLFVVGIPLTGITIFIVQNGKLLAILLALLIAFNLFKKK